MPYSQHELLDEPSEDTPIWRYRDLAQLIYILENEALWFSRADRFSDPLEGSVPEQNPELRYDMTEEIDDIEDQEISEEKLRNQKSLLNRHQRKISFLNCWHVNDRESVAMWDLYASNGVAIQSTFGKFIDALGVSEENILAGLVSYIDFSSSILREDFAFAPFFVKRLGYRHERELRALVYDWELAKGQGLLEDPEINQKGKSISVDIDGLIEAIYVAPDAPNYVESSVMDLASKYGFEDLVERSSLDEEPVY